jgi:hypothetical protein
VISTTVRALGVWVSRVLTTFVAWLIAATLFANWRYFPSIDIGAAGKHFFPLAIASVMAGIFHLLPAVFLVALLRKIWSVPSTSSVDYAYVFLFLVTPLVLDLLPAENFSFGVSEGQIIDHGHRTELGWKYLYLTTAQSAFHMSIYLALRVLVKRRFPKLHAA